MKDSAGNDTHKGRGTNGELKGTGFQNRIKRFETVTAFSSKGKDKLEIAGLKYIFNSVGP